MDTPDGRGTVVEVDLLRQRVKVKMEDRPDTISVFKNKEIAVLRSGKAKKTDPPIPADLAPISGAGRRRRFQLDAPVEEKKIALDSIRLRYSTETLAEETEEAPAQQEKGEQRNRRRRNGRKGGEKEAPKQEKKQETPKAEKPQQPKAENPQQESGEQKKKPHRRGNHRRRRPAGNAPKSE